MGRNSILLVVLASAVAYGQERQVESVVPALAFGGKCSSTVSMQNLSDRWVLADVEAHRPGGALAPIFGHPAIAMRLAPGEKSSYKPEIDEETEGAWVRVRERVPSPTLSPVLAISGITECVVGDELKSVGRDVVFPTRNPWFSGDVAELNGALVSLINTTERAVKASLCYSSGNLYSVPGTSTELNASLQRGVRRADSTLRRARIPGRRARAARTSR